MKKIWHKILVALRIRKKGVNLIVRWYPENPTVPGWTSGKFHRGPIKDKPEDN